MARQVPTALRAPGIRSGSGGPNVIGSIVKALRVLPPEGGSSAREHYARERDTLDAASGSASMTGLASAVASTL
jgi:hypothetical protein